MKYKLREKIRYRFEIFMSKNPTSIFLSIFGLFILCFFVAVLIRFIIIISSGSTLKPLNEIWTIILELADPGNLSEETNKSRWFKLSGIINVFYGMIIFSLLIAYITTQLESIIYRFRAGSSKVFEKNHVVILGWNDRIINILQELIIANKKTKNSIIILANKKKKEMDEEISKFYSLNKKPFIITRFGMHTNINNLKNINISKAKSIIILDTCEDTSSLEEKITSDTYTIKALLATLACEPENKKIPIVMELFESKNKKIVEYIQSDLHSLTISNVERHIFTNDRWDILGKIMVQTSLTTGLQTVYNEILSFNGCEIYFHKDNWKGKMFYEIQYYFKNGIPIGIKREDNTIDLRPARDRIMGKGDSILLLAEDESKIKFENDLVSNLNYDYINKYNPPHKKLEKESKKILILGWHRICNVIISECSNYLKEDSVIDIMIKKPSKRVKCIINDYKENFTKIDINILEYDPFDIEHLKCLDPFSYDTIFILSQKERYRNIDTVDAETLMILILLKKIFKSKKEEEIKTKIITQILNSINQDLLLESNIDDFIISNELISKMLARISERPLVTKVYEELFKEEGSELYIKPINLYFSSLPTEVKFIDILKIANLRSEICIGVRIGDNLMNTNKNFGVELNPSKDKVYKFKANDCLVVLAENEL